MEIRHSPVPTQAALGLIADLPTSTCNGLKPPAMFIFRAQAAQEDAVEEPSSVAGKKY